ncbi:MAG: beta-glucanase, partial [Prevotella pectinovora]|nr:beta-glucanase [Prevotella pectinovora]
MKFLKIFSFLLSLMLLSCSSSSDGDRGDVTVSCSPTSIDVPAKGGTYKLMVVASEGGWEARAS